LKNLLTSGNDSFIKRYASNEGLIDRLYNESSQQ